MHQLQPFTQIRQTVLVIGTPGKMLPCGKLTVIPIGWGSSSGTQVSGSAPAGGIGYASLHAHFCCWSMHGCEEVACMARPGKFARLRHECRLVAQTKHSQQGDER